MVAPGSSSYAPVFFTPHSETIARKVRENLNSPGSDSMLVQVDGKDSGTVVDTLIGQIQRLLDRLITSLTWDRGTELAHRARLTVATDVAVYFCDPRSPWQRGSNENTNGLLRQYFPKGTDLSAHSQADLDAVALRLNTRPRKTLGFQIPAATLAQAVATTG